MKQIIYNGAMGQKIIAGGIPFTAGKIVEVNDDAVAVSLLAKANFSEAPVEKIPSPAYSAKITPETPPNP